MTGIVIAVLGSQFIMWPLQFFFGEFNVLSGKQLPLKNIENKKVGFAD